MSADVEIVLPWLGRVFKCLKMQLLCLPSRACDDGILASQPTLSLHTTHIGLTRNLRNAARKLEINFKLGFGEDEGTI